MNGLLFLAGVVSVVLKLAGVEPVADWSWWLVTLPFWAGLALALVLIVVALVTGGIAAGVTAGVMAVKQGSNTPSRPTTLRRVGK